MTPKTTLHSTHHRLLSSHEAILSSRRCFSRFEISILHRTLPLVFKSWRFVIYSDAQRFQKNARLHTVQQLIKCNGPAKVYSPSDQTAEGDDFDETTIWWTRSWLRLRWTIWLKGNTKTIWAFRRHVRKDGVWAEWFWLTKGRGWSFQVLNNSDYSC